jgi:hypothetical protein
MWTYKLELSLSLTIPHIWQLLLNNDRGIVKDVTVWHSDRSDVVREWKAQCGAERKSNYAGSGQVDNSYTKRM